MLPAYYTLIAAGIGAIVALTTQFLSSKLTTKREQKKIRTELIAEERSLAYLLTQYYVIYIDEIILSAYYLRLAAIANEAGIGGNNDMLYESGNESLNRAEKTDEKIRINTANYFKIITHFTILTKESTKIISLFEGLDDFKKPIHSFADCKNIADLNSLREKELKRLKEEYRYFANTYYKIFKEMKKSIKYIA
jgi:hypothetical protein